MSNYADDALLAKRHGIDQDGNRTSTEYGNATWFTSTTLPINTLDDLAAALECPPTSCLILGRIRDGADPTVEHLRRLHDQPGAPAPYEAASHRFVIVDYDGPPAEGFRWLARPIQETVRRVIAEGLPRGFAGADAAWRLTGSAGIKPGVRLRLAFMLSSPVSGAELKLWFVDCPHVDTAIFGAVQPIYGDPVFDGVADPIAVEWMQPRAGIMRGGERTVAPPPDLSLRAEEARNGAIASGWQQGEPIKLTTITKQIASLPAPTGANGYQRIVKVAAAVASANCPDDPDCEERCNLVSTWAATGDVLDHDGQDFRRVFHSVAKPGEITYATLCKFALEAGYRPDAAEVFAGMVQPAAVPASEVEGDDAGRSGPKKTAPSTGGAGEEWGEPHDLFGKIASEPVLTRDMLPPVIADYAFDVAERIGVDPAMVACSMLATAAAAIDDRIKIQPKILDTDWLESARLWILLDAPSGAAKSPAINFATGPLEDIDRTFQQEDTISIAKWQRDTKVREAAEKHALESVRKSGPPNADSLQSQPAPEPERPPKRRLVIMDTTTEGVCRILRDNPRGVLLKVDEAMGWITSFDVYRNGAAGKDRAFWLQTDNGGHYAKDRADEKSSIMVPNLSASIIGGIQTAKLRAIAKDLHEDGLIQRAFVIITKAAPKGVDREPNQPARSAYKGLLSRLVDLAPAVPAEPVILDWEAQGDRDEIESLARAYIVLPTTPEPFKQHLNKWPAKFARLLLLFHLIEHNGIEPYVSAETSARVRKFMLRYLLPHQKRFYTDYFRGVNERDHNVDWIAGYILAHKCERITMSELKRANHEFDAGMIYEAMETLERMNWIGEAIKDRTKRSVSWPINPKVHLMFADRAEAERKRREETKRTIADAAAKVEAAE